MVSSRSGDNRAPGVAGAELLDGRQQPRLEGAGVDLEVAQDLDQVALAVLEELEEEVLEGDLVVLARDGEPGRGLEVLARRGGCTCSRRARTSRVIMVWAPVRVARRIGVSWRNTTDWSVAHPPVAVSQLVQPRRGGPAVSSRSGGTSSRLRTSSESYSKRSKTQRLTRAHRSV